MWRQSKTYNCSVCHIFALVWMVSPPNILQFLVFYSSYLRCVRTSREKQSTCSCNSTVKKIPKPRISPLGSVRGVEDICTVPMWTRIYRTDFTLCQRICILNLLLWCCWRHSTCLVLQIKCCLVKRSLTQTLHKHVTINSKKKKPKENQIAVTRCRLSLSIYLLCHKYSHWGVHRDKDIAYGLSLVSTCLSVFWSAVIH